MAYYIFKKLSEVDPARAHAHVTHASLASLPIPSVDFTDQEQARAHAEIVTAVDRLLAGKSKPGGTDDRDIELALRSLWGLTAEDGAYINAELAQLPPSQAVRELFPEGIPDASPALEEWSKEGFSSIERGGAA